MVTQIKMIDIHTHILAGVDDGAQIFADSVELVKELAAQGVTDIIATPHFVNETNYISPRVINKKLLSELTKELELQNIAVNVYLGNEIYIDEHILDLLQANKVTTLADSNYLLIELPLNDEYSNYLEYFTELMNNGYKVILAHPERYAIVQDDFEVVQDLCDAGVLLQCNLGSVMGKYGRKAFKVFKKLAKNNMIFAFGSDIHHARGDDYYAQAMRKLKKYYSDDLLEKVLVKNPRKIIVK